MASKYSVGASPTSWAMTRSAVDFHMHTNVSDGVWTPHELFDAVRAAELEAFSVSDHDTIDAYPVPPDLAARVIPGMEVDTKHGGGTAHVLAYGIADPAAPIFERLRVQRVTREERMCAMLERLATLGVDMTLDDVRTQARGASSLGRPHLARALVARGVASSVDDAFARYLADDADAFVRLESLSAAEAIALIRASGGVAVIAHPVRLRSSGALDELRIAGIDGVEVVHPSADDAARARLLDYAREYGLLATGGSDFHAPAPGLSLGVELPPGSVEALRERIARRGGATSGAAASSGA